MGKLALALSYSWEKGRKTAETHPESAVWLGLDWVGPWALADSALSGMFRRSTSLAIPHLKSFAAIPSVSLVQLRHTNRNVFLSHESQYEIALV